MMKNWRYGIKKLEEKVVELEKEGDILADEIAQSINDELIVVCKELLRNYKGLGKATLTFSWGKLEKDNSKKKRHFYIWEIYLDGDDVFLLLLLCGSKEKPFPHMLGLESADNYDPNFKETYRKTISPRGLRLLFDLQLEKMGFQKRKEKRNLKLNF